MSKSFSALFDNFRAGQKTSKIVKKCQKVFRHFSTIFARHLFSGPFCNPLISQESSAPSETRLAPVQPHFVLVQPHFRSLDSKDLLHPLLTTFGNLQFSGSLPELSGERKKPMNIKNFGGTPPGVRPICPGDTSHLSRDMSRLSRGHSVPLVLIYT